MTTTPSLSDEQRARSEAVQIAAMVLKKGGPLSTVDAGQVEDILIVAEYILQGAPPMANGDDLVGLLLSLGEGKIDPEGGVGVRPFGPRGV